jgi:hypothetical protein
MTLKMEFGDGSSQVLTIPQGTGTASFSLAHQFLPPPPPYYLPPKAEVQKATIVQTGAVSTSVFVHGQPHIQQGESGDQPGEPSLPVSLCHGEPLVPLP